MSERATDFETVILPYRARLLARALQLTGNSADAADLVQDTLEQAFKKLEQFLPGTNAGAWVQVILERKFIDHWRRKCKHEHRLKAAALFIYPDGETIDPPAWKQYTGDELSAAMWRLPSRLRRVYELRCVAGLSYEEIAVRLGIPRGTVGTHIWRARRELRARLEGLADVPAAAAPGGAPMRECRRPRSSTARQSRQAG